MVVTRANCSAVKDDGSACRAAPLRARQYCFWHDPEHQDDAAEARRLGGLRRRRESAVGVPGQGSRRSCAKPSATGSSNGGKSCSPARQPFPRSRTG